MKEKLQKRLAETIKSLEALAKRKEQIERALGAIEQNPVLEDLFSFAELKGLEEKKGEAPKR